MKGGRIASGEPPVLEGAWGRDLGELKLRSQVQRWRNERDQGRGALGSRRGRKGSDHRVWNARGWRLDDRRAGMVRRPLLGGHRCR